MNKLLLIDGNSLTYRGYYATVRSKDNMKTSSGFYTNAVLSTNNMLYSLIFNIKPTHIFIAFDANKITKRHSLYKDYKGGRKKTPDELLMQLPLVKEMIQKMGIKTYETEGWEADDIIASVSKMAVQDNFEVKIVSWDKDLLQLVNPKVQILMNNKGVKKLTYFTNDNFFELIGHKPNQVADIKGIMGDSSDNLPGVKGIGTVGANKLILQFGTLENIYNHIEEIKGLTKEKLLKSKDMALLCKRIAILNQDLNIPFILNDMLYKFHVNSELIDFFEKYELNSLLNRYLKYLK